MQCITPLEQRAIEARVAAAFLAAARSRLGDAEAVELFTESVESLARDAAAALVDGGAERSLRGLWTVWQTLGGEGRLDIELEESTDTALRFRVTRCAYAEMYRELGLSELGVRFSCRRDAPFARALVPGVRVTQSQTILEGSHACEFAFETEER